MSRHSGGGGGTQRSHRPPRHLSNHRAGSLSVGSAKTWDMGLISQNLKYFSGTGEESQITGAPGTDPDYVMQLVNDVRRFADVLNGLRETLQTKDSQAEQQERLGDLLRVLRTLISTHPALNSVQILGAAGTVITKVKGVHSKEVSQENRKAVFEEIYASIDTLAFIFGNVVSDFLMGDVNDGGSGRPRARRSRSFDNLSVDPGGYAPEKGDFVGQGLALSREEEVDLTLMRHGSGVESALLYAKACSKYIKELLAWMEKRLAMDIEWAKSYAKLAESAKTLASQQDYMPFRDIYVSAFMNDIEHSQFLVQTATALQTNKFIQPLLTRKNELDKLRKEMKDLWQREQKRMHEAELTLRKARSLQAQRREDHQKVQLCSTRSQEEPASTGNKQTERRKRLEEEAQQKAEEAQDQYRSSMAEAGVRRMDLANTKSTILTQLRELVFQCDLTLKAVTVNWFQMQQAQNSSLPPHFQALSESAKLYQPGQQYTHFVRSLPKDLPKERLHLSSTSSDNPRFLFNKRSTGSAHSSHGNLSQMSVTSCDILSADESDSPLHSGRRTIGEQRSTSSTDIPAALGGSVSARPWGALSQGGMCSDSESAGGSSETRSMDSPTTSPGDFKRRLLRTPSTGTMSSADDLDEREPPSPSDNVLAEMVTETASSPGPFRNAQMSKASQTHRLRKLRAPSKCRECDSLVVFHGAECEECSLACHKKCLETLAIQCGHKKLEGRLQLFGVDFALAAKNSPDGVPFIISKCTSEIEARALGIKGIYRVNGAKSRVEKLCQAFENGKDLVELSDLSPHDISNVLKLYLRQLPEPLIMYRYYNDVIGLAKESQRVLVEEADPSRRGMGGERNGPSVQLNRVLFNIRDKLRLLPAAQYRTLRFLIAHLHRVSEHAEENKMTASNLGIIFGPTLVKPRQTGAEVSLSSLVDYPYQALMVELLVSHYHTIFQATPFSPPCPPAAGHASPRLDPQHREQMLSRHSTSLVDIKESAKVYKRHSSVIPTNNVLDEVREVQPGSERGDVSTTEGRNGLQASSSGDIQTPSACDRPSPSLNFPSVASKIQLRHQRARLVSRPISMPLERLVAPAQASERSADPAAAGVSQHPAERGATQAEGTQGKGRAGGSSRVSTYYITPFIDTQAMQRRTWDRKYKHYDVTPRTAMIVANLPPARSETQPALSQASATNGASACAPPRAPAPRCVSATSSSNPKASSLQLVTAAPDPLCDASMSRPGRTASIPVTFRAPRTLQPPPGTFYKPPPSVSSRARTLPYRPTVVTAPPAPRSPHRDTRSPTPGSTTTCPSTSPSPPDSRGSSADLLGSRATPSPPLSPAPCSADELSPGEAKPIYQRLRPRRLQELEPREAHFV